MTLANKIIEDESPSQISETEKQDISHEVESKTQELDRETQGYKLGMRSGPNNSQMTSKPAICSGQDDIDCQGVHAL